ncbi:MAG: ROK family protein [Oscillospiraceae bacterium]|nr:ROK family protein [Oscillospiraceae bacterium]
MNYLGIDLGGTNIKGGVINEAGEILREASRPTRVEDGADAIADGIAALIRDLEQGETFGGVGLGCPGTVDDESGEVVCAFNLGLIHYDLRLAIKARTGYAIRLGNDANVAALAEAAVGAGKGAHSTVVITLGTGVGCGVVLEGKMLTGYTGAASELGHMVIEEGGEPCTCGRKGCFEAYASATALIRMTRDAMAANAGSAMHAVARENGAVDGRTAFTAAQCGDAAAEEVVHEYVKYLASGVTNVVNIFFPEIVAFSGGVANQGEALLAPLREEVRRQEFGGAYVKRHAKLVSCTLGYQSGIIGAALLAKA